MDDVVIVEDENNFVLIKKYSEILHCPTNDIFVDLVINFITGFV